MPRASGIITRPATSMVPRARTGSAAISRVAETGTPRVTTMVISVTTAVATPYRPKSRGPRSCASQTVMTYADAM